MNKSNKTLLELLLELDEVPKFSRAAQDGSGEVNSWPADWGCIEFGQNLNLWDTLGNHRDPNAIFNLEELASDHDTKVLPWHEYRLARLQLDIKAWCESNGADHSGMNTSNLGAAETTWLALQALDKGKCTAYVDPVEIGIKEAEKMIQEGLDVVKQEAGQYAKFFTCDLSDPKIANFTGLDKKTLSAGYELTPLPEGRLKQIKVEFDPHADIRAEYDQLTKTHARPWEEIEFNHKNSGWKTCAKPPSFGQCDNCQYRRKPRFFTINGTELKDERVKSADDLVEGATYWLERYDFNSGSVGVTHITTKSAAIADGINAGAIHHTREAAEAACKARYSV